jgi:hypothetical protein
VLTRGAGRIGGIAIGACAAVFVTASAAEAAEIINAALNAMVSLQLAPSGTDQWQPDLLKGGSLAPNAYVLVYVSGDQGCFYDARATFEDGQTKVWRHLNLCGPGAAPRLTER